MWNPLSWVMEAAAIMAIALANGGWNPPSTGFVNVSFNVKSGDASVDAIIHDDEGCSIEGEDDGSTESWNEVLDSDVEEMRLLKVSFDEEFKGMIRWWFGSVEGWVVSHVLSYRAVA
ncbi:hypothetical protein V6N12_065199 [Hibiscus sabdariffa]|uniref:Uncharacterized protein n=1 Tax=Hibiscus sabdariffa TaxID=183260 RepID=A0ABR2G909_9ROSI